LKVDHATIAGENLGEMRRALAAVGLPTDYGGPHANHATEMALVSFPDGSYLELMGIQKQADPTAVAEHQWSAFLRGNAGPCAWAVRATDVSAEVARLKAAGIPVTGPMKSGRQRPDGVVLKWETAQVGPSPYGTYFPFLIRDLNPRELRVYFGGRPSFTSVTGVKHVVIAVKDLDHAIEQYRKAYGFGVPARETDTEFGAKLATFTDAPVILAAPSSGQSWLAGRLAKFGEAPCAFVLGKGPSAKLKTVRSSKWFGNTVAWTDDAVLGWRLGIE
jgi:hypothetical protein